MPSRLKEKERKRPIPAPRNSSHSASQFSRDASGDSTDLGTPGTSPYGKFNGYSDETELF